ncbi:MAG TPA: DUF4394 domain-containing protein, partial [Solimonas sp.]|nr:DUF4394 domain-containing protein [Solimonas sp.]
RAIAISGENFRVSPVDGSILGTDTTLAYVAGDPNNGQTPSVEGVAYTGAAGAAATTAYVVDGSLDLLARLGSADGAPDSANTGKLTTIGPFGTPIGGGGNSAFDVETGANPVGYLTDLEAGRTVIYRVNLTTGALTRMGLVGPAGSDIRLVGLSVVPGTGSGSGGGGGGTPPPPVVTVPGIVGDGALCTRVMAGPGFAVATEVPAPPNANLCLDCSIADEANLVDTDLDSPATVDLSLGLLFGSVSLTVTAPAPAVYTPAAAGQVVGAVLALPGSVPLEVAVAPDVTIDTLLAGAVVETATFGGDGLILDIGGQNVDPAHFFVGFNATKPFDAVRVTPSVGVIAALTVLEVYHTCSDAPTAGGSIGMTGP